MGEEKHEHKNHEHHEHEAHKHVYMEHKQHERHENYKMAAWILGGLCVLLLIGLIISLAVRGNNGGASASPDTAKASIEKYLESIAPGQASVDSITDMGDLYVVKLG